MSCKGNVSLCFLHESLTHFIPTVRTSEKFTGNAVKCKIERVVPKKGWYH